MKGALALLATISTTRLLKRADHRGQSLAVGDSVRVRTRFSPLAGKFGRIAEIDPRDAYGPYLVQFDEGFQFRYRRRELALTSISDSAGQDR